ncbi:hypothetical protein [Leifsonia poae]|uniref:Uncharacterized protein n=1 Tax=Leifsonia poae TaxID=110933 RepID=A0A9W6LYH0_9MICO|nr:hypothetical protein [Leifsonia poae]GLJ74835.1 hypothetical protein GCM10017584_04080 [Leifsonia poae]
MTDASAETQEPVEFPDDEYAYGGYTVRLVPVPDARGTWRVENDERYFGLVTLADPVNGDPGVHFASRFPGEEDIPPTTVDSDWTKAVQFLIDAKD